MLSFNSFIFDLMERAIAFYAFNDFTLPYDLVFSGISEPIDMKHSFHFSSVCFIRLNKREGSTIVDIQGLFRIKDAKCRPKLIKFPTEGLNNRGG